MSQQPPVIDPNDVPITYSLNLPQVNLILKGLGKLPHDEVEKLYNGIRSNALQALQAAEKFALEQIEASKNQPAS